MVPIPGGHIIFNNLMVHASSSTKSRPSRGRKLLPLFPSLMFLSELATTGSGSGMIDNTMVKVSYLLRFHVFFKTGMWLPLTLDVSYRGDLSYIWATSGPTLGHLWTTSRAHLG
jgi:hypothetical protein